jgi:PPP family 3-phenylpropionic acid transporter
LRHDAGVSAEAASSRMGPWGRLAAFYAASFAVLGVYMQFFPVWLHDERGLGKAEVALVLSAQTISRTLAGPLWSQRVDRTGRPRTTLWWLSLGSVLAFAAFGACQSLVGLWLCAFVFGCLYPPMHPILDTLALQTAQRAGFAYGRVRMVGSLSFLLVILGVGWWLESAPSAVVLWLLLGGLLLTTGASAALPDVTTPPSVGRAPIVGLLRSGPFVLLLVASGLIQGSHATYYNLSTIHWIEHGIGKGAAGVLWAEGVLAEIVLFFFARGWVERWRPTTLLMVGGLGAAVRWLVVGASTSVPLLLATNWLHALSFTCTYLGALRALERRVEPSQRSTAQGLLGAANSGVGMVVCGLLGGYVYDRWEGLAFFLMAAFALGGVLLAFWLRRKADQAAATEQVANTSNRPA